ncbi:MAG: hypothetical protein MUE63_09325, partial [Xanthomonadales bacterium]|nr:hypothetical protein [Xanthomonadales bacterium]
MIQAEVRGSQRGLQYTPEARAACLPVGREAAYAVRIRQQAGQDHGVEFQALGLVDGHQLQAFVRQRIGQGEQLLHALAHPLRSDGPPAPPRLVVERPQEFEKNLDVLGRGRVRQAQRPAQRQPGAFDPVAQRRPLAVLQRGLQYTPEARAACLPVGREAAYAVRIRQQAG